MCTGMPPRRVDRYFCCICMQPQKTFNLLAVLRGQHRAGTVQQHAAWRQQPPQRF